ncbi:MAG: imidazole glycerol phosphate synthase subunit HisH [Verrucomicrobiota bacterium]|jgi:glutamine amidotransferase
MIALIDYGSGNLRSVYNALIKEGAKVQVVAEPEGLLAAKSVVLPGVGAFGDCVRQLQERRLWEPLRQWISEGRPYLGICLGYQMLFESSEESPNVKGLGFFQGKVTRFRTPGLKVPQIGWNSIQLTKPEDPLWKGLPSNPHVYFVHSFYPEPVDPTIVAATCDYGVPFAAAATSGQVGGVQFHPEKSQEIGLGILRNFLRLASEA